MRSDSIPTAEDILAELSAIKRLFVYGLMRSGASQSEVAHALGVDQSQVSRMFPTKSPRSAARKRALKKR